MAHPVLFGFLGALVVSRLVMRRRWRHLHGGGCARRRGAGPIDLGVPDRHRRRPEVKAPPLDAGGALELNQRQRELFDEVVVKAKQKLGVPELAEALGIIGREPLDRSALEFLVGKGELADDLEHLHFSLTPEQRAKLRTVAGA